MLLHRPREDLITWMRDHEKLGPYSKYFLELQIQTVTFLSYFPITVFCDSPPHCCKVRPGRQFSMYNTRITIISPLVSIAAVSFTVPVMYVIRSHYKERTSALDFKDAATLKFGHSNIVFDLLLETSFSHLITLLFNF